jgi:hypothetical protein
MNRIERKQVEAAILQNLGSNQRGQRPMGADEKHGGRCPGLGSRMNHNVTPDIPSLLDDWAVEPCRASALPPPYEDFNHVGPELKAVKTTTETS